MKRVVSFPLKSILAFTSFVSTSGTKEEHNGRIITQCAEKMCTQTVTYCMTFAEFSKYSQKQQSTVLPNELCNSSLLANVHVVDRLNEGLTVSLF